MSTAETSREPSFETNLGKVFVKESIIRDVIIPEVAQSSYFFPPKTRRAHFDREMTASGLRKEISVTNRGPEIDIAMSLDVLYGVPINSEAKHLQDKIKRSVELATGLKVGIVDLTIEGLTMPGEETETGQEPEKGS